MAILEKQYLEKIQVANYDLDSKIINDLIRDSGPERARLQGLWNRYRGETPIKDRVLPDPYKTNSKLAHDFRGQIVSQICGYLWGNPIVYGIDDTKYNEKQGTEIKDAISRLNNANNVADLDMITGEYASVCGAAYRLLYIDKKGQIRLMNVVPWECLVFTDSTLDEVQLAIILYQTDYFSQITNKTEKRWKIELLTKTDVYTYYEYEKGIFQLDPLEKINPMPHMFNGVPVIKFDNNNLVKGDFENVEDLIDGYDVLVSDAQNELIDFRLAYLGIVGAQMDEKDVVRARQTGVFTLPEGIDIKWIVKDLPTAFFADQAKRLRDNIYTLSSTIDFNDQAWSGNSESGLARRLRMQSLESKAIKKERKFQKALEEEYELIAYVWSKKNLKLDPYDMVFVFVRDLPIDYSYYFAMAQMAQGTISEETILSLMPFIPDPSEEIRRKEKERVDRGKLIDLSLLDENMNDSGSEDVS